MAGIATPPPASPAAPSAPTAPPSSPPGPPSPPSPGQTPSPESDPNLAMSQIVARSKEKHASGAPSTPPPAQKQAETPPSAPPAAPAAPSAAPPAEPQKLTDLLGKALKFTPNKAQTTPPAAPADPAAPIPAAPAPAAPAAPAGKKTAKGNKAPAPMDTTAMVTAATTAATEAAMRAIQSAPPAAKPAVTDELSDDDRRDYEVAEHLARMDPRYADAPKIILEHVSRAEDYAARWEAANPGKEFDATDDEHDEFFSTLQRPWTSNDFNEAKIDLSAEKKLAKFKEEQQGSLQGLHRDQAHMELAPVVDRKFVEATTELARAVSEDVHKILTTDGWDGLHKSDPVTAKVMAATLDQLHPFVEAAIEIDDPRQRVAIDTKNNPSHAHWNQVVSVGESRLVGQQLDDGRVFARRADYVRMAPSQQAQHWYLTTEMIIKGALDYAAEQVKIVAQNQKDMLKSLGFVRQEQIQAPGQRSVAPQGAANTHAPPLAPASEKPVSPTVGSGAKIDDTGGVPKSGEAALMQQISGILFRK